MLAAGTGIRKLDMRVARILLSEQAPYPSPPAYLFKDAHTS
ncbi:MAG: hypothetical protein ACI9SB_000603 [Candidatus Azotimanducaceae bacterium]|jgi:hypothetical protein